MARLKGLDSRAVLPHLGETGLRVASMAGVGIAVLGFWIGPNDQFELPKLTALAACAGGGCLFLILGRLWPDIRSLWPMGLFLATLIPSTLLSESPFTSLWGDYENFAGFWTWSLLALLSALASVGWRGPKTARIAVLFASAAGFSSLYALLQAAGWDFISWDRASTGGGRSFGSLGNPNFLSAAAAAGLPWSLGFLSQRNRPAWRLFGLTTGAAQLWALGGAGSRGGFLAALIGVGVFFYCGNKGPKFSAKPLRIAAIISALAGLAALSLWSGPLGGRMIDSAVHPWRELSRGRLHIWEPALRMAADHPLTGTGLDTFKIAFPRYQSADFGRIDGDIVSSRTAHNEPLQFLATAGLIGLCGYLFLAAWAVMALRKHLRESQPENRPFWAATAGSLAAYWVQSLFSFGVTGTLAPLFLLLGILAGRSAGGPPRRGGAPGRVLLGALGFFFAFSGTLRLAADSRFARGMAIQNSIDTQSGNGPAPSSSSVLEAMDLTCKIFPWEAKYRVYRGLSYEKALASLDPSLIGAALAEAESEYQSALALAPLNPYYHNNVGRIREIKALAAGADPEAAASAYQKSAELAPHVAFFWANLGLFETSRGRLESAKAALVRCLELSPGLGEKAIRRAADFARRGGDSAGAAELEEILNQSNP